MIAFLWDGSLYIIWSDCNNLSKVYETLGFVGCPSLWIDDVSRVNGYFERFSRVITIPQFYKLVGLKEL